VNLLGRDEHTRRLSATTFTLAGFLVDEAGFEPPRNGRTSLALDGAR
jgi:hypothetical protein